MKRRAAPRSIRYARVKRSAREVLREPKARFIAEGCFMSCFATRFMHRRCASFSGWRLQRTKKASLPECSWFAPSKSFTRNLVFARENERNEPDSPRPSHEFGKQTENILFKAGCKAKRAASPSDEGVAPPTQKTHPIGCVCVGGATRNRTGDKGFADPCLTAWPWRHI